MQILKQEHESDLWLIRAAEIKKVIIESHNKLLRNKQTKTTITL